MHSKHIFLSCLLLCLASLSLCTEDHESSSPRFMDNSLALAGAGVLGVSALVSLPYLMSRNQRTFRRRDGFATSKQSSGDNEVDAGEGQGLLDGCWKMAICDSHARYDDYGIIALPLVMLYPG